MKVSVYTYASTISTLFAEDSQPPRAAIVVSMGYKLQQGTKKTSFGIIRFCEMFSYCVSSTRGGIDLLASGEQQKQLTCNLNKSSWQLKTHFSLNTAFMLSMRFITATSIIAATVLTWFIFILSWPQ